jgi:aspartyl aminopeptidase
VFVGFDHEEIGSGSARPARPGPLLETVLTRLAGGFDARHAAAFARSRCLSVDVTHAAHPNHLGQARPRTTCQRAEPAGRR